jgi:hypothetical protein
LITDNYITYILAILNTSEIQAAQKIAEMNLLSERLSFNTERSNSNKYNGFSVSCLRDD